MSQIDNNQSDSRFNRPNEDVVRTSAPNVEEIKRGINDLQERVTELDKTIENNQLRTTEILAIFITLFTFISVNVTIFSRIADIKTAIAFMLIMTLCSLVILTSMFLLIDKGKRNRYVIAILLLVLCVLIGVMILAMNIPAYNLSLN